MYVFLLFCKVVQQLLLCSVLTTTKQHLLPTFFSRFSYMLMYKMTCLYVCMYCLVSYHRATVKDAERKNTEILQFIANASK